jgi:uncharacterized protein (DUF433 family)
MTSERVPGLGLGVYTHREAAMLAGIRPERVARWVRGYRFKGRAGQPSASAPIFESDWEIQPGAPVTLSFLDLVEMLFVKAFLDEGVSMPTIRKAALEGARLFQVKHPFCVKRFETDGRTIFASIEKEAHDERLVDLARKQAVFKQVIRPLLHKLRFDVKGFAASWWPRGESFPVVLDPARSFGAPIVAKRGIPTRILAGPVLAGDPVEFVARMYRATVREVESAVAFEQEMAAAA